MNIEYFHASKYGNGVIVAEEFKKLMTIKGATVNIHHVKDVRPKDLAKADLYVFSSPGRLGKPTRGMRHFLTKIQPPMGSNYAIITTEGAPRPNKSGQMPTEEEMAKWQRVIPVMNERLLPKGMNKIAEGKVLVTGMKGPLEEDWERKVEDLVAKILSH